MSRVGGGGSEGFPVTGMFGGVGWWRVEIVRVMVFGGMG